MKGTVYKNVTRAGTVSWRYQIIVGRDEHGKLQRESKSGFALERDADDAMHEAIEEAKKQRGMVRVAGTLGEFLRQWLPYHAVAKQLAPKTAERYESLAAHATSALGDVLLKHLTPFMFDDLYVRLATRPEKKLAPKTIREVHNVIHVAMKRAVKTKLIAFNPADGCDLPRVDQPEMRAMNHEQLDRYEEAVTGSWVDLLVRLGGALGARRGELVALTWDDLNWDACTIRIERSLFQVKKLDPANLPANVKWISPLLGIKPTKNRTVRVISIPQSLVEYLRIHKEQQEQKRALIGSAYRSDRNLIFADPAGEYLLPGSVSRAAGRFARGAGLDGVQPLHSLRHSHASILLHEKVEIAEVARRLGHRDAYTTAKIYQHALPNTDQDVAATWDKSKAKKAGVELRAHRVHIAQTQSSEPN